MAQPYVGEIRMFAGNFAPAGWVFCDGQLLPISENETLFNLIGTTYGGDGQSTFAVPDLRGRIPIHAGTGPGLSSRILASSGGAEEVTLTVNQIPAHSHVVLASGAAASSGNPSGNVSATTSPTNVYSTSLQTAQNMNNAAIAPAGGSQPHSNLMPALCVNFIISLFGIFPSPS